VWYFNDIDYCKIFRTGREKEENEMEYCVFLCSGVFMCAGINILFDGIPVCGNRSKNLGTAAAERLKSKLYNAVQILIGAILIIVGFKIFVVGIMWGG
ncbi:MAG: hypothetical protein LUD81_04535, partial [Clostridiales bacterium]|nr:hypothetical protein [Clostridiales bacterium]